MTNAEKTTLLELIIDARCPGGCVTELFSEHGDAIESLMGEHTGLLAACRTAARAMAGVLCDDLDHDDADETLRVLRAAIAKAEGQP